MENSEATVAYLNEYSSAKSSLRVRAEVTVLLTIYMALVSTLYLAVFFEADELFFGTASPSSLNRKIFAHVLLNAAVNTAVVAVAASVSGRPEERIRNVVALAILLHLALAMTALFGRLYYSRSIMFSAVLVSVLSGIATVVLMQFLRPPRMAVIGDAPAEEIMNWLPRPFALVRDPGANLIDYGLVLVDFHSDLSKRWIRSISEAILAGADVRHIAEYVEGVKGRVSVSHFSPDHFKYGLGRRAYGISKRGCDVVTVIVVAPFVLLLLCAACIAVIISMGRPVFFVQERTGLAGRTFRMYKLRTMRIAHPSERPNSTVVNDVRITPLGRILRRYRIDELPQMWHVLKGDMSLIGPRPEQPALVSEYTKKMPAYAYRHLVRPGISGWAQVCYGYAANTTETREKLSYDLYYVKYGSWYLDMQIAFRTIKTLAMASAVR